MLVRPYEMPWRRAYEAWAGWAWLATALYFTAVDALGAFPPKLAWPLCALCLLLSLRRLRQAVEVLRLRSSLRGRGIELIGVDELQRHRADSGQVFLGFGFEWQPVHAQRLYELAKIDYREFAVPRWLQRLLGRDALPQPDAEIGLPYIHGVEPLEGPLHLLRPA